MSVVCTIFRLKCRFNLLNYQSKTPDHIVKYMVRLINQGVGCYLERDMAIAQVIGSPG
tara:strand:+ start:780 stop:953 length:174 start_codon:yes stop_codon:yes gene_type:complete